MSTPTFTAPGETRGLTIHVSDRVFTSLVDRARVAGYTPAFYAKLLFEAAYAARCGKGEGDPLLEACVAKSLDRRPAPAATPAARPAETRVVHEAVAVPVPVLIPVPIAVPVVREPAPAEPMAVHISTSQPIEPEAAEHLATLIGAAVSKFAHETPDPAPGQRPQGWTASQWTFVGLVCRDEGASFGEVMEALAPGYQDRRALGALVSATRPKLRSAGIEIENINGWGWRVERHTRAAADALIGRAA